ncbi:MAG TPA: hypothetical protein VMX13_10405 [Sedimentisphaerales bacterium]|nr:hypothetical protein [Sedimentisphaerales bacterium]
MKIGRLILAATVVAAALSEIALGIENPAGLATVPPSSIRSGLVPSPNPINTSGNLLITGNVGGDKHFRGVVPYRATSDFSGSLGSASLDSFLRRSYIPSGFDLYTRTYQPYYSPSRTITTAGVGQSGSGIGRLSAQKVNDRVGDGLSVSSMSGGQLGLSEGLSLPEEAVSYSISGVAPSTAPGSGKITLPGIGTPSDLEESADAMSGRFDISRVSRPPVPDGLSLEELSKSSLPADFREQLRQVPSEVVFGREIPNLDELPGAGRQDRGRTQGLERVEASRGDGLLELPGGEDVMPADDSVIVGDGRVASVPEAQRPAYQTDGLSAFGFGPEERSAFWTEAEEAAVRARGGDFEQPRAVITDFGKGIDQAGQLGSETYLSKGGRSGGAPGTVTRHKYQDQAREILGPRHSVASYSREKFEQYIRSADDYLKLGEYYRAADSYSLAMIYEKDDPTAYAGRGHALFAAGEYISGALFISRALEAFGGGAKAGAEGRQQKDATSALIALRGNFSAIDKDDIEKRIVDAEQWRKTSDVGELHFLLAYIYYQVGRAELAKAAIEKAYEKMPKAPVVIMLKSVIESAANRGSSPTGAPQDPGR